MHYYHITCRLPNASEKINGVKFEMVEEGDGVDAVNVVQTIEAVDEATARQFHGIPGYEIEPVDDAPSLDHVAAERRAAPPPRRGRGRPSNAERAARAAAESGSQPPATNQPPAQPPA